MSNSLESRIYEWDKSTWHEPRMWQLWLIEAYFNSQIVEVYWKYLNFFNDFINAHKEQFCELIKKHFI